MSNPSLSSDLPVSKKEVSEDIQRYTKNVIKPRRVGSKKTGNLFKSFKSRTVSNKRRRKAKVITSEGERHDALERKSARKSQTPKPTRLKKPDDDPFCESSNDILQETHDGKLAAIHKERVECDANPFLSEAYCKQQTDDAIEELRKDTETQRKAQETKGDKAAFEYPDTNDPQFYQKWSDCFAGPRYSSCDCNFVVKNDLNPKSL